MIKIFSYGKDFDPVIRVVELGASSIDVLIVAYAPNMNLLHLMHSKKN